MAGKVWLIESSLQYLSLNQIEKKKFVEFGYDYDTDSKCFDVNDRTEGNNAADSALTHGTIMTKIVASLSTETTKIDLLKVPMQGNNTEHIAHCLGYVAEKSSRDGWNIVLMTLGNKEFR